ncbi:MAG: hypothetical protein JOZ85_04750, partial [Betaproteobacteria bacterium]|nr:hypothetical protein [Betaproteobacteria bacterium]
MHTKRISMAAAVALALGVSAAQAQTTMGTKPSVDRAQKKADRDKIEAD